MTAAPPLPEVTASACRDEDPERFFPRKHTTEAEIESTKAICRGCPFLDPCLAYARVVGVDGIWGATTADERAAYRKEHRIAAEPITFGKGSRGWGLEPHGTPARYRAHLRAGEKACGPCREAEYRRAEPYRKGRTA